MRIAIVDQGDFRSFPVGGSTTFLASIVPELAGRAEVHLFGVSAGDAVEQKTSRDDGSTFHPYRRFTRRLPMIPERLLTAVSLARARKAVLAVAPDVIYVHQPELMLPFAGVCEAKRVLHLHGLANPTSVSRFKFYRGGLVRGVYQKLYEKAERAADLIVSVSRPTGDNRELQIRELRKAMYLPVCVDTTRFANVPAAGTVGGGISLGYVGRVSKNKRVDLLVRAIAALRKRGRDARLSITGSGEAAPEVRAVVNQLGVVEHVDWCEALPYDRIPGRFATFDILGLPSDTEGFPMVVLEALAAGRPVIARDVGSIKEVVQSGVNGFLVDWTRMDEAVDRIIATADAISAMGRAARYSAQPYEARRVAEQLLSRLKNL